MSWKREIDTESLSQRLRSVLPEYRCVSERVGEELGTFKAIDREGNVWLVTWVEPIIDERNHFVIRRKKRIEIKAEDVAGAGLSRNLTGPRRGRDGTLDD